MKKENSNSVEKMTTLDGLMTIGKFKDGLHSADFMCCEDGVNMETFSGLFRVQGMWNGNIYMTEKPKRKRNTPIFRDDNSSLSLGRDGKYYFSFSLPQELIDELPEELIRQASAIAKKVLFELI